MRRGRERLKSILVLYHSYDSAMSTSYSSCSLHDLLPGPSTAPNNLNAPILALIGNFPASTVLHYALNHLERQEEESYSLERNEGLSEKAKGKRKAFEDDFADEQEGDIGDLEEEGIGSEQRGQRKPRQRHVLVLTPNLPELRQRLVNENDVSLFGRRQDAEKAKMLDRITFK